MTQNDVPQWSAKEKQERSEWFVIAGFIGLVGLGIFMVGLLGMLFWVHRGPDFAVDVLVCSMAMGLGLVFMVITSGGVVYLSRQKPGGRAG